MHLHQRITSDKTPMYPVSLLIVLIAIQSSFCQVNAQSIAASLSEYRKETSIASVEGVSARSFSGVTLHQPSQQLYIVDNDDASIYVLSLSGTVERIIPTSNLSDPEGISHLRDNTFFIAEEGRATILRVEIPAIGTDRINVASAPSLQLGENMGNSGIEGVSYRSADNTLYAVKELGPSRLYRITLDEEVEFVGSSEDDPFTIEGIDGDAADIAALNDGNFIIVNQQRNRLEGYGPDGEALSSFSLDMQKPEGIAVDTTDGTIYMVGEPREFCILKPRTVSVTNSSGHPDAIRPSASAFRLSGNSVQVTLTLARTAPVTIDCFQINGRRHRIFEKVLGAGSHTVHPVTSLPKGTFLFRIRTGTFRQIFTATHL